MAKCLKLYAIYAFSTKPGPCHYTALLNADVLKKFLPNTGFITIRLLRFGVKVKRAYCRGNFLAQRPLPDICMLSWRRFFVCFNRTAPRLIGFRSAIPGVRHSGGPLFRLTVRNGGPPE